MADSQLVGERILVFLPVHATWEPAMVTIVDASSEEHELHLYNWDVPDWFLLRHVWFLPCVAAPVSSKILL